MTSPLALVPNAIQVRILIEFLTNRTLPSANSHVHAARMPAIRVAEVRPPAGADATAIGERAVVQVRRCDRVKQTNRHRPVRPVITALLVSAAAGPCLPRGLASLNGGQRVVKVGRRIIGFVRYECCDIHNADKLLTELGGL